MPDKLNVKAGSPLSVYFNIIIVLVFSRLLVWVFGRFLDFSGDIGFLYRHTHPDTLSFLNFFSEWWLLSPLRWPVDPFQLRLPPGTNL